MTAMYIVPTRGRPVNAVRLAQAWHEHTSPNTRLTFILDDDDPELAAYENAFAAIEHACFGYLVGPRLRLGGTLNHHAPIFAKQYHAIGFMGDDHLPRTHYWDAALYDNMLAQGGGVVYGNDLIHGPNIPTAALLSSTIIRALDYMVPPGLIHLYMDNFWRDLGHALGQISYREDVIIEHMHPLAQKAPWDDRYAEVNAGAVYAADRHTYEDLYVRGGSLQLAVETIRKWERENAAA